MQCKDAGLQIAKLLDPSGLLFPFQITVNQLESLLLIKRHDRLYIEEIIEWLVDIGDGGEIERGRCDQHAPVVTHEPLPQSRGLPVAFPLFGGGVTGVDLPGKDFVEILQHDQQCAPLVSSCLADLGFKRIAYPVTVRIFNELIVQLPPLVGFSGRQHILEDLAYPHQEVDIANQAE